MKHSRGLLTALLRLTGVAMLGGLVFVFCPFAWMQRIHTGIGMGELEYTPLMSYLTRTLSAMYAVVGATLLFVSLDIRRYLPLIRLLGVIALAGGVGVTLLDAMLRLPAFWTLLEGPLTIGLGVALLVLSGKVRA
ncbi:MAG: hypothetical protein RBS72_00900 [Sedimentisphaerales bacterium]|jgi:hypothetical protein|nr:hypothetical protein [Sedimentisphaerales bacterium]HNY76834.1 hypothetical protein [Sedimentisphaerales bacterium]HOC62688.1 hypothetical protein [Sedimentisphaerales bacterium]HOH62608.1 hypothetical protein [Sedimentisphaerales bacterium]HPY49481.1 hypothetical protein [Sedimentisphaerales bacterium]